MTSVQTMHERAAELGGRCEVRAGDATPATVVSRSASPQREGFSVIRVVVVDDHLLYLLYREGVLLDLGPMPCRATTVP